MSALFFDSSALVKRYLTEIGSTWVAAQINPGSNNVIVIAEITRVEVAAALAARHRAFGNITLSERDRLFRLLAQHHANEYRAVPISVAVADHAMNLPKHIACAATTRCSSPPRWPPPFYQDSCLSPPTMICSLLPAPRAWRPRIPTSTLEENIYPASSQPMLGERPLNAVPADLDIQLAFGHHDSHCGAALD